MSDSIQAAEYYGYKARDYGYSETTNPYPRHTDLHDAWQAGYWASSAAWDSLDPTN